MSKLKQIDIRSQAQLHGYLLVEELRRAGVEMFCISPGARLIPILKALESLPQEMLKFFNDERSAAFYAQGVGKAGKLACLLCTSGTAAANYFPAVVEASLSQTPLLVLTTDRPAELLYTKSNQTISQTNLYGDYTRLTMSLPAIESRLYPQSLLANVDQAVATAKRESGPVHLNVAYRKPFVDDGFTWEAVEESELRLISKWTETEEPFTTYHEVEDSLSESQVERLRQRLEGSGSVAVVCGPLDVREDKLEILALAERLDAPLFADVHSGLRSLQSPSLCVRYNSYLSKCSSEKILPETVLYFGDRIVSEQLREHLSVDTSEFIQFSSYRGRQDGIENEFLSPTERFVVSPSAAARVLFQALSAKKERSEYAALVFDAEARSEEKLHQFLQISEDTQLLEESNFVGNFFAHLPKNSSVFVSASLLLREAEHYSQRLAENVQISANRGATGIDGVLSSALGYGEAQQTPLHVLIGDQALLHDLNALALVNRQSKPCHIFVVNNSGGSIFHFFDVGRSNQMLENAHLWEFHRVAEMFGLAYECPRSMDHLLRSWQQAKGSTLFELRVNGERSVADFKASATLSGV